MGLLDSVIEAAKQQYQTTKRGFGLLASNPQQFAQEATTRYFPTKEEEAQFAQAQASGGDYTQTPYYQKVMNLSQFQGSIKPTGLLNVPTQSLPEPVNTKPLDYRGSHTPPNAKVYGATIDNLGGIMPADVYSSKGANLYGIGNREIDSQWFSAAYKAKGKPDADVTVYRAVPKGVKDINNGDWVTTSKRYAQDHGENTLSGEYEIVSKKVKAKTLSSEGYPYEFGYNE